MYSDKNKSWHKQENRPRGAGKKKWGRVGESKWLYITALPDDQPACDEHGAVGAQPGGAHKQRGICKDVPMPQFI